MDRESLREYRNKSITLDSIAEVLLDMHPDEHAWASTRLAKMLMLDLGLPIDDADKVAIAVVGDVVKELTEARREYEYERNHS